ncbi:MAG: nucleotidyltransferase family protein [Nitrospirota bacterium]
MTAHGSANHVTIVDLLRMSSDTLISLPAYPDYIWDSLLDAATTHRVLPFLYPRLKDSSRIHALPPLLHAHLKQAARETTARNLFLTSELCTIVKALDCHGIPSIPIRGPALAHQLYDDPFLRPAEDLDLLVHRHDLPAVAAILTQQGYRSVEHRQGFLETFSYSLEFVHPVSGLYVEPHWSLVYPPYVGTVDMAPVWARAVRQQVAGIPMLGLGLIDLVIHLCVHLLHRGDQVPFLWLYELDRLLREKQSTMDWDQFVRVAHTMGQGLLVAQALSKVIEHCNTPLPPSLHAQLTLSPHSSSLPTIGLLLTRGQVNGREEFAALWALRGLRSKLRYVLGLLFPSPDFMLRRYRLSSYSMLMLYYPLRFVSLLWEGAMWVSAWLRAVVFSQNPQSR